MIRKFLFAVAFPAVFVIGGCSTVAVDREAAGFDEAQYEQDLGSCGGDDTVFDSALSTGTVAFTTITGAALGAVSGVYLALAVGSGPEAALAGLIFGGAVGSLAAFQLSVGEERAEAAQRRRVLAACLRRKGYDLSLDKAREPDRIQEPVL